MRISQYLLAALSAVVITFLLPRLSPGDPTNILVGSESSSLTPAQRAQLAAQYGLDGSLASQAARFGAGLLRGDLGVSTTQNRPVLDVILERLPWTLLLVVPTLLIGTAIGVAAGVHAAARRGSRRDLVVTGGMLTVGSMPGFWIAMVLIAVFAARLRWFPSFGATPPAGLSPGLGGVAEILYRLVLPVATLVLASVTETFLITRGSMTLALDHANVRLAEAAGVPSGTILRRHALPMALLPISTRVALLFGTLVSGSVVVEGVFTYPGLGQLVYQAVLARDYPMLQGAFLTITLVVIAANLAADLVYPLLDPRVARSGPRRARVPWSRRRSRSAGPAR